MLAENSVDWLVADLAILSAGAVDVPMHAPLMPNQVAYQLRHSGARGVVVSNQAQADKVLAVLRRAPRPRVARLVRAGGRPAAGFATSPGTA